MEKELRDRLATAIDVGRKVRSEYYESIELPDEQELGEPASEKLIVDLESQFGAKLPESYRQFLMMHDGWKMVQGDVSLLPLAEQLEGSGAETIKEFKKNCEKYNDDVGVRSLVIGIGEATPTMLMLDPMRVNDGGEWALVVHHHGEEDAYPSFVEWLEQSADEFAGLDEDFDDEIE